ANVAASAAVLAAHREAIAHVVAQLRLAAHQRGVAIAHLADRLAELFFLGLLGECERPFVEPAVANPNMTGVLLGSKHAVPLASGARSARAPADLIHLVIMPAHDLRGVEHALGEPLVVPAGLLEMRRNLELIALAGNGPDQHLAIAAERLATRKRAGFG